MRPSQVPVDSYRAGSGLAIQRSCAGCSHQDACETCKAATKSAVQAEGRRSADAIDAQAASRAVAVVAREGEPLDDAVRGDMEDRLGADFSSVRIHTDALAAASAEGIHARSYTVGETVVFGAAAYAPQTLEGRRTLAHELVHVQQQRKGLVAGTDVGAGITVSDPADRDELKAVRRAADAMSAPQAPTVNRDRPGPAAPVGRQSAIIGGPGVAAQRPTSPPQLQREGAPPAPSAPAPAPSTPSPAPGLAPIDVAMVLVDDPSMWAEAQVLSSNHAYAAFGASALEQQMTKVDSLGVPIGTLYLMAHANDKGELIFETSRGLKENQKPSALRITYSNLHLKNPPATVSIRGCRLGKASSELASFAGWVGAQSASASNCYYAQVADGPVALADGTNVLAQSDVQDPAAAKEFQRLFDQMVNAYPSRQCIAPLAKGESWPAARQKVIDAYFASGNGQISIAYVNQAHTGAFGPTSTCVKDLPAGQGSAAGCVMVTAAAPTPAAPQNPAPPAPPVPAPKRSGSP